MNLHESLIAEILGAPQTPRDHAAKSEIEGLRAQIEVLKLQIGKPSEEAVDAPAPRPHKSAK